MQNRRFYNHTFLFLLLIFSVLEIKAQENPPIPIEVEVRTSRNLNFGSFTAGSAGGNVTVSYDDQRTVDGDIFELNFGQPVSAALFDVYANPGTIIQIEDMGPFILENQDTGLQIQLLINSFSTGHRTFVTQAPNAQVPNEVFVGGTLRIPSDNSGNLPGTYFGTFTLNFIHQ
ncbi:MULTISPECIES: DUF4402 domain-containing protein [Salegentibacter]|uniref:DUF4402 domain-containing protein n=1 Tax=Salegentibacter maritimus TaxID=2794347 RepID=A0ABS0TCX3_9FLAO|nr:MULTISPECIES: DUF4402 domain-containing protein [Salegentibacter]MBE7638873.1 DUF4402 domain-containing protein [Salegentibacter sp. BLCTC]MBI6115212.1 DUF4402 domain-containing protein [Salegentibacter maritimus]MBI6118897.1 DUF4402 domain-containing protein [Salegentibacter maritimus]